MGDVLRYLMGGLRHGPEPAHHDGGEGKGGRLQEHVRPDGHTYPGHSDDAAPTDAPPPEGPHVGPPLGPPPQGPQEHEGHEQAREQRSQPGAQYTQLRTPPFTEDKDIVEEDVEQVGDHGNEHRHAGVAQPLEELLADAEEQQRQQAKHQGEVIGRGEPGHAGHLPHPAQEGDEGRQQEGNEEAQQQAEGRPVVQQPGHCPALPPDVGRAHQRRYPHSGPHRKDHPYHKDRVGKGRRGQFFRSQMPYHHGVGQLHDASPQLRKHDGDGHPQVAPIVGEILLPLHNSSRFNTLLAPCAGPP